MKMTLTDTWLLIKKILLGIVITAVPLAILTGGLWITQRAGHSNEKQVSSAKETSHAN
jgi:hypothetical protein